MNITEFTEQVRKIPRLQYALDDSADNTKCLEASNINNGDPEDQVKYLISDNPSSEELENLLNELRSKAFDE